MKVNYAQFVHINHIVKNSDSTGYCILKARINPHSITSYEETLVSNYEGEVAKKVVAIFVSGRAYFVDMTISQVDEMMNEIERTVVINETD